jgi:hypothetical protein
LRLFLFVFLGQFQHFAREGVVGGTGLAGSKTRGYSGTDPISGLGFWDEEVAGGSAGGAEGLGASGGGGAAGMSGWSAWGREAWNWRRSWSVGW